MIKRKRLTRKVIEEIIYHYNQRDKSTKEIAEEYGITTKHMYYLVNNDGWKSDEVRHQTPEHRENISKSLKEYNKAMRGIANIRKVAPGVWKQIKETIDTIERKDRLPNKIQPLDT